MAIRRDSPIASPFGQSRRAAVWLTIATAPPETDSAGVKKRPLRNGTSKTVKNSGEANLYVASIGLAPFPAVIVERRGPLSSS